MNARNELRDRVADLIRGYGHDLEPTSVRFPNAEHVADEILMLVAARLAEGVDVTGVLP